MGVRLWDSSNRLRMCLALARICPTVVADVMGRLQGTAADPTGDVFSSALVILRGSDTGLLRKAATEARGDYEFSCAARYFLDPPDDCGALGSRCIVTGVRSPRIGKCAPKFTS
jgi:hypothetical protein